MYRYKRDQGEAAATAIGNLAALLYTFGAIHAHCPGRRLGRPITAKRAAMAIIDDIDDRLLERQARSVLDAIR